MRELISVKLTDTGYVTYYDNGNICCSSGEIEKNEEVSKFIADGGVIEQYVKPEGA